MPCWDGTPTGVVSPSSPEPSAREHPTARVIVTFFPIDAGPERFVIGHVPTDGGPLSGARPSSALATFDYPRPSPPATAGAP